MTLEPHFNPLQITVEEVRISSLSESEVRLVKAAQSHRLVDAVGLANRPAVPSLIPGVTEMSHRRITAVPPMAQDGKKQKGYQVVVDTCRIRTCAPEGNALQLR